MVGANRPSLSHVLSCHDDGPTGESVVVKRMRGGALRLLGGKRDRARDFSESSDVRIAEIQRLLEPIRISYVSPLELKSAPRNARWHSQRHVTQVAASINEFGFIVPIIIDNRNTVLAGHGRLAAALQLDLPRVPVVQIDYLSEAQKCAFRLADNRLAELSSWDEDVLKLELAELSALDLTFDIEITGFDTSDLDRLLDGPSPSKIDPADILPPFAGTPAISRQDDVWLLGPHRLLCGDARDADSYARVLRNDAAQMVFTDPPYNVPIRGHASTRKVHREFLMASGEMSSHEFVEFLKQPLRHMASVSCDGAIHFLCMDWRHMAELLTAAAPVYGMPKQLAVWVKHNAGMGSFYRSQHEFVFVFKVGNGPHINNFGLGERGRYRTNVWQYPGANSYGASQSAATDVHPTVKPVALVMDAIKDCSRRNGVILDPFGGSGTTLMAAERTNRIARMIEFDPLYVDLIIQRWQTLTGGSAVHENSGKSFEEVSRTRTVMRKS
jgi:ParB-like chromosome segregation protein Spo0J